jgi:agmatine deiminase
VTTPDLPLELDAPNRGAPFIMPAEWAPHDATWIAWPHHEPDWPEKFEPIPWVYAEIVRALAPYERVEILCHDEGVRDQAYHHLDMHGVDRARYRLHHQPTDRTWLRDSGPTGVHRPDGSVAWMHWDFDAWSKYDNFALDVQVPRMIAEVTALERLEASRPDNGGRLVLEGGGIEVDGLGTMLVTEEWLLSDVQVRNPGMTREHYERAFAEWLGITHTVWLGEGCVGDDTHGHVDDVARFVAPGIVVLAHEEDPLDENHRRSLDNLHRLQRARDARGRPLEVVTLPFPRAVEMGGVRLPASYANFYIGNGVVLVPTFNDRNDREALERIATLLPTHDVVGIHGVDLVWGLGTLHCLTQQQPAPAGVGA